MSTLRILVPIWCWSTTAQRHNTLPGVKLYTHTSSRLAEASVCGKMFWSGSLQNRNISVTHFCTVDIFVRKVVTASVMIQTRT